MFSNFLAPYQPLNIWLWISSTFYITNFLRLFRKLDANTSLLMNNFKVYPINKNRLHRPILSPLFIDQKILILTFHLIKVILNGSISSSLVLFKAINSLIIYIPLIPSFFLLSFLYLFYLLLLLFLIMFCFPIINHITFS